MRSGTLNYRRIEALLYTFIWLLVFSVPFFVHRTSGNVDWREVAGNWIKLVGLLILFLLNIYLLVPELLLKKRYLYYSGAVLFIIAFLTFIDVSMHDKKPPMETEINAPTPGDFPIPPPPNQKPLPLVIFDNIIICLLITGTGTTTKLVAKWLSEEKLRKDIEKEQLKTSLALLRHQVSPHFFMNTLNNIHALIDINSENAKDAIIRLSTLMRYLLYDSSQEQIKLKKEIEFVASFISLMQLRYSDKVEIKLIVPEVIPDISIPPMLLNSFLENAFKHGVSYQLKSFIFFEIQINGKSLICKVRNSKHKTSENQFDEYSGIGLDNVKKSLNLLYGDDYSLEIYDTENEYEVNLKIKL